MGDQHDGRAARLQGAEGVGQHLLVVQVDAGGRLVEEEQLGVAGERAGDEHPLLLAAGEGADAVAGAVGEADEGDGVVDGLAVGGASAGAAAGGGSGARR